MTLHKNGLVVGSSPHTRGAPPTSCRSSRNRRIIPAYAGSTSVLSVELIRYPDHPRIRGEHVLGRLGVSERLGSSPHTRGAPAPGFSIRPGAGIIPAYAGSTAALASQAHSIADHPRIRGEHPIAAKPDNLVMGSSPHTRGAPSSPSKYSRPGRIIPAYAGSTGMSPVRAR